jgi:hypothetical protein
MKVEKTVFKILLVVLLFVGTVAAVPEKPPLSVVTRNLYVGDDLMGLARATDFDSFVVEARAFLTNVALSNFPERARSFAQAIEEFRPDVIALQEVYDFRLNGMNGPVPFVNYLGEVQDALAELGLDYIVAASVQNTDVTVPIDLDDDGTPELASMTDRDVILVRAGLADTVMPVPFALGCARPSADDGPGCNYSTYASVELPFGTLILERGFVGVDVTIDETVHRIVVTHLEVEDLDLTNPLSPLIQSAQASELKAWLDAFSAGVELLVVGDFNSTPDDPLFPDPVNGPYVRPYQQLANGVNLVGEPAGAAYEDTWLLRPGRPNGYTCCDANLFSNVFEVVDRRDLVFSYSTPSRVKANVFGNNAEDKSVSGLWPSDHAGLFVRLWFESVTARR